VSKRSRVDIYSEILEALKRRGPTKITRVSYAVGLPVDRIKRFLADLSSFGLVKVLTDEETSSYSITHRGLEFLEAYWKLVGFLKFLGDRTTLDGESSDL
jgi:predicted transcriptional regulator